MLGTTDRHLKKRTPTYKVAACGGAIDGVVVYIKEKVPTTWAFVALQTWLIVLRLKETGRTIKAFGCLFQWSKFALGAWNARRGPFKTGAARLTGNATLSIFTALCAFRTWF